MSEPKIFWYDRKELDNPIAIVGFPSVGLVGSILTSFLARELRLPVIGGITLPDIQQYAFIQNGNAYPPIRIHAGPLPKAKRKKKKTEAAGGETTETPAEIEVEPAPKRRPKARDVVVISSEITPKPEFNYDFTVQIMDVLKELNVRDFVFVDGIPRTEPNSDILGAYSNEETKKKLEEIGVTVMNDGIIRGISGVALYMSKIDGTNTVCLIAPANPQIPDPRSAAMLLEPLKRLVPRLDADPSPLFMEGDEIENRIRAQQNQQSMVNQNLYG